MRQFKIVIEKHADGYLAYPLGLKGIVVGEGNTYEEALADIIPILCNDAVFCRGGSPCPPWRQGGHGDPPLQIYDLVIANWYKSAIRFHIETFGNDVLEEESPVLEAFVAEAEVAV